MRGAVIKHLRKSGPTRAWHRVNSPGLEATFRPAREVAAGSDPDAEAPVSPDVEVRAVPERSSRPRPEAKPVGLRAGGSRSGDGGATPADQSHVSVSPGHLHFGAGPAHAHAAGLSQSEMLRIERDILGKNDSLAAANRTLFQRRGVFTLNLVSSPGSGKTTLLVRTLQALAGRLPLAVIEGDQQTEFDAERIRETGVPALQINTGKGCHLDAGMVASAIPRMELAEDSLLLIENVGNLVCPAAFDLGEVHKVVILSVTEGEDKPLKYPDMFAAADLMLLNKTDLLPYLSFDTGKAIDYARRVNPRIAVLPVSATRGDGLDDWLDWIMQARAAFLTSADRR